MDIRCKVCGEPWDVYSLHEMGDYRGSGDFTYEQARKRFYRLGCGAFDEGSVKCNRSGGGGFTEIVSELQYLLGDDVDGLAALEEDFGL